MIIGLTGLSRSGKDSIAAILVKDFGFEQRVMADGIREILLGLNPLLVCNSGEVIHLKTLFKDCAENWDAVKAESTESVDLMIRLGQTCRDVLGNDVWLDRVLPNTIQTNRIVISDVRQPNEYHRIKQQGGYVWKVTRPGTVARGMDSLLTGYEFDATIDNRGSLVDLRSLVSAVATPLFLGKRF